jgi:hypothetical protein
LCSCRHSRLSWRELEKGSVTRTASEFKSVQAKADAIWGEKRGKKLLGKKGAVPCNTIVASMSQPTQTGRKRCILVSVILRYPSYRERNLSRGEMLQPES